MLLLFFSSSFIHCGAYASWAICESVTVTVTIICYEQRQSVTMNYRIIQTMCKIEYYCWLLPIRIRHSLEYYCQHTKPQRSSGSSANVYARQNEKQFCLRNKFKHSTVGLLAYAIAYGKEAGCGCRIAMNRNEAEHVACTQCERIVTASSVQEHHVTETLLCVQ